MEGASASSADPSPYIETGEQEKENYVIRRLEASDYSKGFMELLEQLSAGGQVVSEEQFLDRLREVEDLGGDHFISVIEDANSGRIVATGGVFLEKKFLRACGKVGHIEDVVVDSSVRGVIEHEEESWKDLAWEEKAFPYDLHQPHRGRLMRAFGSP